MTTIARVRQPGIVPREIWAMDLGGVRFQDRRDPEAVIEAAQALGARALWLAGGRLEDPAFVAGVEAVAPFEVRVAPDPRWYAEAAARALAGPDVTYADMGQTALKLGSNAGRLLVPRLDLCGDLATSLAAAIAAVAPAASRDLVLSIAAALDDAFVPGDSTYPGLEGDAGFIGRVVAATGRDWARVLVLNDAELAGIGAAAAWPGHPSPLAVITLGFAPGGCIVSA